MGVFDEIFRAVGELLIELAIDVPADFERIEDRYDSTTDSKTPTVVATVSARISPPTPFDWRMIDGKSVLAQDVYAFVAATSLEAAGFDPVPTTGVRVRVAARGQTYGVERVEILTGGDENAVYGLHLRR